MHEQTARPHRHWWRVLVAVVAIPIVLVLALWLLVPRDRLVRFVLDRALPAVSQTLGRQVTVASADVDLLPMPQVSLQGLRVAGGPGEPDALNVSAAKVRVSVWKLLTSRGRTVEVRSIALQKPDLTLVRRADGTWSHDEVLRHVQKESEEQPSKRNVRLDSIVVDQGRVLLVDRQGGGSRSVALDQLDVNLSNVAPGSRLSASLDAALASRTRNLHAKIDVEPLPAGPLTPENAPTVSGHVSLDSLSLAQLAPFLGPSLDGVVNGGDAKVSLDVRTPTRGTYALDGKMALKAVQLHGQPASGDADLHGSVALANPQQARLSATNLHLKGPGLDAAGEVRVQLPSTARFSFTGSELDLDTLLGVAPRKAEGGAQKPAKPAGALAKLDVRGDVKFQQVRSGKLTATNLDAAVSLSKGLLTVERGRAQVFGGAVTLDGTRIDLAKAEPAWRLKADVHDLALAQAQQALSGAALMGGAMDLSIDVAGIGRDWARLRSNLDGGGRMSLRDGSLGTLDLDSAVAKPLAEAFARAGQPGIAARVGGEGGTKLKDLTGAFSIENGWLVFNRPLAVQTPAGEIALKGRVGLDRRLALTGTLAAAPALIHDVSGGRLSLDKPLPLPLNLQGSLEQPRLALTDAGSVTRGLVEAQGRRVMQGAQNRAIDELRKRLQH